MPFHRIWRWHAGNGFWETISLADLGVRLYGGRHDKPCPQVTRPAREMVFVHENGVTTMPFVFCECTENLNSNKLLVPEPYQLLEHGFFPASWKEPCTAFTMGLMRSYHLLSLQTHCSAEDYYKYIKRTTDNISPDSVPVSNAFAETFRLLIAHRIDTGSSTRQLGNSRSCGSVNDPGRRLTDRSHLAKPLWLKTA